VALAQGLRYWAIFTLGERWNVRILVLPNAAPVTRGPYRWVRHPNYVAVVMEILLVPLVHGAWLTAAAFTVANAVVLRIRIRAEEAALGPGYAAAFAGRPRFIPGSA
jgi:methyltransferase